MKLVNLKTMMLLREYYDRGYYSYDDNNKVWKYNEGYISRVKKTFYVRQDPEIDKDGKILNLDDTQV